MALLRGPRLPLRRLVLVMVSLLGLLALVLGGRLAWGAWGGGLELGTSREDLTPAELEAAVGLKVPPQAGGLHSHLEGFQDWLVHVRFSLPTNELPAFLLSIRAPRPEPATELPYPTSGYLERPWWTPGQAKRFSVTSGTTQFSTSNPLPWTVMIDTTSPERVVVYMILIETS